MDDLLEMPFLGNIGLIMTYKCQASCPHCIINASPQRTEDLMMDDAYDWIEQIARYKQGKTFVLSLTGGEPFFDIEKLKTVSEFAGSKGLFVSAVTNAFWADDAERAVELLEEIPDLRMLSISTDVYHQEYIPFERVKNAMAAAETCHIPYTVSLCTENYDNEDYRRIVEELVQICDEQRIITAITFPVGRALQNVAADGYKYSSEPPVSACAAGSSPIIFPDGRIFACIGPIIDIKGTSPLYLGNIREQSLDEILNRAEVNPILHAIRIWGPRTLIQVITEMNGEDLLPDEYIKDSICDVCYRLFSSPQLMELFEQIAVDEEFIRKVAYGRVFYLKEEQMVVDLDLER